MAMQKMQLTTHWSPEEAYGILLFIDELRETLLANHGADIADYYRQRQQEDTVFYFEDVIIPF